MTAWLTIPEVAARLGVSRRTVFRYVDAGRLTAYHVPGGRTRFDAAQVEQVATPAPVPVVRAHPGGYGKVRHSRHPGAQRLYDLHAQGGTALVARECGVTLGTARRWISTARARGAS